MMIGLALALLALRSSVVDAPITGTAALPAEPSAGYIQ